MKVLVTGATGYIGQKLMFSLVKQGHHVVAFVRNPSKLKIPEKYQASITPLKGDLLKPFDLPKDLETAYYLVHSMESKNFDELEQNSAQNFVQALKKTKAQQIIFLSGIIPKDKLSKHLKSRKKVEDILRSSGLSLTTLRAAIIVGSGSASFEIIRDLTEKLPVMVAPKWVNNPCQPIWVYDVIDYLIHVLGDERTYNKTFDIGGPDVLSFKEILLGYAKIRGLKRHIFTVPVLTPRLSSYWLVFITRVNYHLAQSIVDSMKHNFICENNEITTLYPKHLTSFEEAVKKSFTEVEDASEYIEISDDEFVRAPTDGCMTDHQEVEIKDDPKKVVDKILTIGGKNGWHYMNWAWKLRGWMDECIGGKGAQFKREERLKKGDLTDLWKVILADEKKGCLLLYANVKIPGEAWLEMYVDEHNIFHQIATYRPKGVIGRLYWYLCYPFHYFLFRNMAKKIASN